MFSLGIHEEFIGKEYWEFVMEDLDRSPVVLR